MSEADTDGRHERSSRSRRRIVDAMIALVRQGVREPTAEQVAARAGLAMRTVFRHFRDMDSLYREISVRMHDRGRAMAADEIGADTWQQTLHNLVDRRTRIYEEMTPMRLAADALRHRSPFLQQDLARFVGMTRQALRQVLPAEVTADRQRFEALDGVLSFELWLRLRREQRLSAKRAAALLHGLVDAVLAAPPGQCD